MTSRLVLLALTAVLATALHAGEIWWLASDASRQTTSADLSFFANGERMCAIRPDLTGDPVSGETPVECLVAREIALSRAERRRLERTRGLEGYVSRTTAYSVPDGTYAIPEPSAALLLLAGLAACALRRRPQDS